MNDFLRRIQTESGDVLATERAGAVGLFLTGVAVGLRIAGTGSGRS